VFADGSNRHVALVRHSGKVASEGMLRGATVQEWGFHEVTLGPETNGRGTGNLVIARRPRQHTLSEDAVARDNSVRQGRRVAASPSLNSRLRECVNAANFLVND
jgi:hypothetical protein